jgi:hypothetical protein
MLSILLLNNNNKVILLYLDTTMATVRKISLLFRSIGKAEFGKVTNRSITTKDVVEKMKSKEVRDYFLRYIKFSFMIFYFILNESKINFYCSTVR